MGIFDQEASFTLEPTPEAEPAAAATSADEGHVENQESESQAPETAENTDVTKNVTTDATETDESPATQEVKEEKQPEAKLLAGKYKTMGGLVNGIAEAAKLVGETIDWENIKSPEDMEDIYFSLRRQISKGEIKNAGPVSASPAKGPEEIVQEAQAQQSIFDQELQKVIDASNAQLAELENDTEDYDEEFETKLFDDPRQALAERDARIAARLRKEFEARLNLEGAKLVSTFGPYIQKAQADEAKIAGTQAWAKAIENFSQVVSSHGDNDLEEFVPVIPDYLQKNQELYDLVNANPNSPGIREKVLSLAYRDLKLNKKLEEFAKTTAAKDKAAIENSKGGLRIQSGVGGGANNTPKAVNELDKIFGKGSESIGAFG